MTDRAKETLFNILGHQLAAPGTLPGLAVLDVFSGPGTLGLEALSRGAASCTFVERDRAALTALRENIRRLDVASATAIRTDNAWTMRPPETNAGFGLVFVDPPYRDAEDPLRVVDLLERLAPALAHDGLMVFRHETRAAPPPAEAFRTLTPLDVRQHRHMRLMLLARP
jgi:16S rRNA (guanine966-N2)-methyltransferase